MTSASRNFSLVHLVRLCVVVLCATVMAACGGGGGTVGIATGNALFTTAPSAITIAAGPSGAVSYSIGGGTPVYTAKSSNVSVAAVTVDGTTLNISGVAAGAAQIIVSDAKAVTVTIAVTVTVAGSAHVASAVIDVLPDGATGNVGDVLQFLVSGGSPAYSVTINNTSVATVTPAMVPGSGGSFSLTLVNVGSTIVSIVDSVGTSKTFTITVSQLSTLLRVSPSAFVVGENDGGAIDLKIYGGTGPYFALSSDLNSAKVSIVGSTLTVAAGTSGNRCINPVTSDGTYVIGGTYDVIITAVDSLGAFATSIMTIKDNGAGLNLGCP